MNVSSATGSIVGRIGVGRFISAFWDFPDTVVINLKDKPYTGYLEAHLVRCEAMSHVRMELSHEWQVNIELLGLPNSLLLLHQSIKQTFHSLVS